MNIEVEKNEVNWKWIAAGIAGTIALLGAIIFKLIKNRKEE